MSYTYTKSLLTDFPSGLIADQLMTTISSDILTPTLQTISVIDDVVSIIFDTILPDESVLTNIITNYIPINYDYTTPYLVNNVLTNKVGVNEYKYFGNERSEIIISQDSQSHYNTLSAALADNNTPNQVFLIYPGTYIENNPIILPSGTTVKSVGSVSNTILYAQDYTKDLIHVAQKCKLYGLTCAGSYGSGSRGIYFDGSLSGGGNITVISECFIVDSDIGIECDGKDIVMPDTLFCEKLIVSATTHTLSKGVYCHSGGQIVASIAYVYGVPGYFPILNAYDCQGTGSKISLSTSSVWFCGKGLFLDNNGNAEISLLNAQYNNIAVQIGSTGTLSRLSTTSLVMKNSTTYDLDIQAMNANVEIYSSFLDDSKLNNPNKVGIIIRYNSKVYGSCYSSVLGDSQFGSAEIPTKVGFGEGLYINNGIVILTNDNLESGTWINNTSAALMSMDPTQSLDGFNLFQSIGVDNCLYFGSNYDIFGFKINITVPTTLLVQLEDIVWEFWNGTSWIQFYTMATYPDYPCYTYDKCFVSLLSKFNIRFGLTTTAPFENKTLNGFNKKWLRLRVVNALPSIPVGGYVKIHTNSTRINNDGFIEYFGNARLNNIMNLHTYPSNSTLGNGELYLDQTLSILKSTNVFTSNVLTRIGFNFKMPIQIDTGFPIKLNLSFVGDNATAGNVYWTFRYTYSTANSPIYLNLTDSINNPDTNIITINKTTIIGANQNNKDLRETIDIDVHAIPGNPSTNINYIFYGSLERNANVGSDTYPGNIVMSYMDCNYISWSSGGHLLGF